MGGEHEATVERCGFIREHYGQAGLRNIAALPAHMVDGFVAYVVDGRRPGGFLSLLLSGGRWQDVIDAADDINRHSLIAWRMAVANAMPAGAHGSPEAFEAWIEQGGLRELAREHEGEA